MKIAICDDEVLERQYLIENIKRFEQEQGFIVDIKEYSTADSLLRHIHMGEKIDVVFMDIYMEKINGMEAAQMLFKEGFTCSIIFCTCSRDYAVESYLVEADGYMVKPYAYEDFLRVMNRIRHRWEHLRKNISFLSKRVEKTVHVSDIVFIETYGKGCVIHTVDNVLETRKAIGEFEKELESEEMFLRMGKSFLINLDYVRCYEKEFIVLEHDMKLPLPVRERTKIKKRVNEYQWTKIAG